MTVLPSPVLIGVNLPGSSADAEMPEAIKAPSNAHNVTNRRVFIKVS
jgi:hypothetical protein